MIFNQHSTIVAPATVPGSGAISVIRISGADSIAVADRVLRCRRGGSLADAAGYSARFCEVHDTSGALLDEVIATVFRSPHSYTGEDSVEISCHASRYIVETLLGLLVEAGAVMAMPGEFTQRAFVNGRMDLAQAEAVADLIASQSAASHRIAMSQLKGGFSSELRAMRDRLLHIVSLMELELDFSEEEVEFADRSELLELVRQTIAHCTRLVESFRLGNAIKNGIPVAIAGSTNTGKSTLLNALLGEERAIVSDIAGTTRDTIEETLNIGGALFRFIDTAGIRGTDETIEKIGIERTFRKVGEAQVVLAMIDASGGELTVGSSEMDKDKVNDVFGSITGNSALDLADEIGEQAEAKDSLNESAERWLGWVRPQAEQLMALLSPSQNVIFLLSKVDICTEDEVNKKVNLLNNFVKSPIIKLSAKFGQGIDELKAKLSEYASGIASESDENLVTNMRHVQELAQTRTCLERVEAGIQSQIPTDLVSQDIREAILHLGSIVGEISTDEVLGNIFEHFCIGK